LSNANVLILTDETDFARSLLASWQAERRAPGITVLGSQLWANHKLLSYDLVVIGPVSDGQLQVVLSTLDPSATAILCVAANTRELAAIRAKHPRVPFVPLREDSTKTLLLVASESLRRAEALRLAREADERAAKAERYATLGRYMTDMRHSVNNALTSMLGNAELLLIEPGQLSRESLSQIKTIHSMAMRLNEIMQRFSSLAMEMRDAENASQAETVGVFSSGTSRR
jgi:signal transduction histidine kinase